jgi:hypothetical protein
MIPSTSLSSLLDDVAVCAMAQLIHSYEPDESSDEECPTEKWCEDIARTSYFMAAAMMDARSSFHDMLFEGSKGEVEVEA